MPDLCRLPRRAVQDSGTERPPRARRECRRLSLALGRAPRGACRTASFREAPPCRIALVKPTAGPWPGISWGPEPFFGHYWPRLLHFLTPLIQSSDYRLAEDAAQVAFERACDNWDMLQFRCARPIHGCSRWPSASCAARRLRTALAAACMKTSTAPPPRPICEPLPRPTTGWRTTCLLLRGTSPASPRGRGHRPRSPRLHPAGDGRNPRGVANGTVRCQLSLAAAKLRVLLSEAESAPRRNTV